MSALVPFPPPTSSTLLFFSNKPISHSAGPPHSPVWMQISDITFQTLFPWFHPITLVTPLSSMLTSSYPSWVSITFTGGRATCFFLLRQHSGKLISFILVSCLSSASPLSLTRVLCPCVLSSSVVPTPCVWSLLERIYNKDRVGVVGKVGVGQHPIRR